MRYRALDADGDYLFGQGASEFLVNDARAVAQAVMTRLQLWAGEWFVDLNEGIEWIGGVLGEGTRPIYDQIIKDRIIETEGVTGIAEYSSLLDPNTRKVSVVAKVETAFGPFGLTIAPSLGRLDIDFFLDQSQLG